MQDGAQPQFPTSPKDFNLIVLGQILYGLVFAASGGGAYLPTLFVAGATLCMALFARRILRSEGEA